MHPMALQTIRLLKREQVTVAYLRFPREVIHGNLARLSFPFLAGLRHQNFR